MEFDLFIFKYLKRKILSSNCSLSTCRNPRNHSPSSTSTQELNLVFWQYQRNRGWLEQRTQGVDLGWTIAPIIVWELSISLGSVCLCCLLLLQQMTLFPLFLNYESLISWPISGGSPLLYPNILVKRQKKKACSPNYRRYRVQRVGTLKFSSDFHLVGNCPTSCLLLQGWPKLIIFKKQTHALCPWVRGKDKGLLAAPLWSKGLYFFKFIFVCTYLFKARGLSFYKYITGNLYLPSLLCPYSWSSFSHLRIFLY